MKSGNLLTLARYPTLGLTANRDALNRPVVTTNLVPLEAIEQSEKRPFAALVSEAKAATRIACGLHIPLRSIDPTRMSTDF